MIQVLNIGLMLDTLLELIMWRHQIPNLMTSPHVFALGGLNGRRKAPSGVLLEGNEPL